jgi:hypothetical protein
MLIEWNGQLISLHRLAKEHGIPYTTLRKRIISDV